jgi:hypothetical protein
MTLSYRNPDGYNSSSLASLSGLLLLPFDQVHTCSSVPYSPKSATPLSTRNLGNKFHAHTQKSEITVFFKYLNLDDFRQAVLCYHVTSLMTGTVVVFRNVGLLAIKLPEYKSSHSSGTPLRSKGQGYFLHL